MVFIAKVYKLGKSGRMAIMLPKEVVVEVGEYEMEIRDKVVSQTPPVSPEVVSPETPIV